MTEIVGFSFIFCCSLTYIYCVPAVCQALGNYHRINKSRSLLSRRARIKFRDVQVLSQAHWLGAHVLLRVRSGHADWLCHSLEKAKGS